MAVVCSLAYNSKYLNEQVLPTCIVVQVELRWVRQGTKEQEAKFMYSPYQAGQVSYIGFLLPLLISHEEVYDLPVPNDW